MEATQVSPASPAPVKEEPVPDWKLWKKMFLDGYIYSLAYASSKPGSEAERYEKMYVPSSDKRVVHEKGGYEGPTAGGSLCQCCGGIWINERGGWKADGGAQITSRFPAAAQGIYFGQFQDTKTLKKNTKLADTDNFFEIQDGKDIHTFGWRNA